MQKDTNFDDRGMGGKDIEETEQEGANVQYSVSKAIVSNTRYYRLKAIHDLQKRVIRQNIHKAMSPISAISGYLELMQMMLRKDVKSDKIEQYRSKIEEGVGELGEIVEKLHDIFDEEESEYTKVSGMTELTSSSNRRAS